MTNRERDSVIVSSVRVGRCAMSMVVLLQVLRHPPYDAVRWWCRRGGSLSPRPAPIGRGGVGVRGGGTSPPPPRRPAVCGPLQGPTASAPAVGGRGSFYY